MNRPVTPNSTNWSRGVLVAGHHALQPKALDHTLARRGVRPLKPKNGPEARSFVELRAILERGGAQAVEHFDRQAVVVAQRRGGQSQFSPLLIETPREESLVARVQAYAAAHLRATLSVEEVAAVTGMSVRSFSRHFGDEAGMTPREFVERARLDAARNRLEADGQPLKVVAYDCGFGDTDRMRAVFMRRLGVTPVQYREQFFRPV